MSLLTIAGEKLPPSQRSSMEKCKDSVNDCDCRQTVSYVLIVISLSRLFFLPNNYDLYFSSIIFGYYIALTCVSMYVCMSVLHYVDVIN